MVRSFLVAAALLFVSSLGISQNIYLDQLKDAYAKSGEIEYVNGSLVIQPTMPSPLVFFLVGGSGQDIKDTKWDALNFPIMNISADLRMIDETSIVETHAFSGDDVAVYKWGDQGSLAIISVKATDGKPFLIAQYDRDKLTAVLRAGKKHFDGEEIGESREYRGGLTVLFESISDARKFETALKNAVVVAKAEPSTK